MARAVAYTHTFASHITASQQQLALSFESFLVGVATSAAKQVGSLDVADAGKFGMKLEQRFMNDNPNMHAFYRASVGSSIERSVYTSLRNSLSHVRRVEESGDMAGVYGAEFGMADDIVDIVFALEFTRSKLPELPAKFNNSRPDIRLSLGAGSDGMMYEAIYDLTSVGGIGHILKKKDNWLNKQSVAFVSEIIWTDGDIMQK